jgi:fatty acid desaturase
MGIEGGLNAMIVLLVFFFFLPILPIGVWMIGVAALKVAADLADMAAEEGNNAADPAGKRKFFLDEDE